MENKNKQRNIDPQKISAEKLNGRFALIGVIALIGAYITTGQIVPGIIQDSFTFPNNARKQLAILINS